MGRIALYELQGDKVHTLISTCEALIACVYLERAFGCRTHDDLDHHTDLISTHPLAQLVERHRVETGAVLDIKWYGSVGCVYVYICCIVRLETPCVEPT